MGQENGDRLAKKQLRGSPAYPDFPLAEYEERYARARALMERDHLDALLITQEDNYIYFTGHRSQQNPIDKIRPYVFLLPREGDGAIISVPFEVEQIRETTWITDVRTTSIIDSVATIVTLLKQKGLASARIGAEMGLQQYLGISFNQFGEIRAALPKASFVDASRILLELRGTKSAREIDYMRTAAQITSRAIDETFENVRAGMTERDVMREVRTRLAQHGGEDVTFMWVVSTGGGMVATATDRKIEPGEIVVLDLGVRYRGYCSDIARSAYVGEPPPQVTEFYRWMLGVREACLEFLVPGRTPKDLVTVCKEAIIRRGIQTLQIGRIGHGVGLESTEYPSLGMGQGQAFPGEENTVFKPGMVFACNPTFIQDFGWINVEDDYVVTAGACEILSTPPPAEIATIRV